MLRLESAACLAVFWSTESRATSDKDRARGLSGAPKATFQSQSSSESLCISKQVVRWGALKRRLQKGKVCDAEFLRKPEIRQVGNKHRASSQLCPFRMDVLLLIFWRRGNDTWRSNRPWQGACICNPCGCCCLDTLALESRNARQPEVKHKQPFSIDPHRNRFVSRNKNSAR